MHRSLHDLVADAPWNRQEDAGRGPGVADRAISPEVPLWFSNERDRALGHARSGGARGPIQLKIVDRGGLTCWRQTATKEWITPRILPAWDSFNGSGATLLLYDIRL